jgi:hypothetical protein
VRILFDQGTPVPLRQALTHHEVATAYERGWSQLKNGELLDVAENHGIQVFVRTDLNPKHQQNLKSHGIVVVVLSTPSWPRIERAVGVVVRAIDAASPGSYVEVTIP